LLPLGTAPRAQEPDDVSARLAALLEEHDVPALGAGALRDGKLVALGAAGVRKRGSDAAVTVDDRWHLGSCTKAMTATLLGILTDEKRLHFDLALGEVLKEPEFELSPECAPITLRQLLEHRAGLSTRIPPLIWARMWAASDQHAVRSEAVRALLLGAPPRAPGEAFEYANSGYMIAGVVAERVTGKDWETLMRERIFTPLGMTSAGFGAPGDAAELDQPWGHRADGDHDPVPPGRTGDNPPSLGPAGTVHASLRDWSRFLAQHADAASDKTLVSAQTLAALHDPGDDDYALGWKVTKRQWAKGKVLTHTGSNTMWFAVAWVAPGRGLAVFATCNQGGDDAARACDAACAMLLREIGVLR